MLCFCVEAVDGDAGKIQAENPGQREGASGAEEGCGISQGEFGAERNVSGLVMLHSTYLVRGKSELGMVSFLISVHSEKHMDAILFIFS